MKKFQQKIKKMKYRLGPQIMRLLFLFLFLFDYEASCARKCHHFRTHAISILAQIICNALCREKSTFDFYSSTLQRWKL